MCSERITSVPRPLHMQRDRCLTPPPTPTIRRRCNFTFGVRAPCAKSLAVIRVHRRPNHSFVTVHRSAIYTISAESPQGFMVLSGKRLLFWILTIVFTHMKHFQLLRNNPAHIYASCSKHNTWWGANTQVPHTQCSDLTLQPYSDGMRSTPASLRFYFCPLRPCQRSALSSSEKITDLLVFHWTQLSSDHFSPGVVAMQMLPHVVEKEKRDPAGWLKELL